MLMNPVVNSYSDILVVCSLPKIGMASPCTAQPTSSRPSVAQNTDTRNRAVQRSDPCPSATAHERSNSAAFVTEILVIARPGTNLAAEDPIRPRRISDDHRQQKKRTDEEKRLRAGCGGRIPQTD